MLDWISIIGNMIYVALLAANMAITTPRSATLRRLTLGLRIVAAAIAVQVIVLVVHILDVPNDGYLSVVLSLICLAAAVPLVIVCRNRRALKGERVMQEAEQIVRDYNLSRPEMPTPPAPKPKHVDEKES